MISYIGLGSNEGESFLTLREAARRLAWWSVSPLRCSSLWRTAPVDCPPGSGDFLNAVVGIEPAAALTPEQLLQNLQELERGFGRAPKKVSNEARPLDLDILAWGNLVRNSGDVLLPHPRAHRRRFVLAPWAEIAPDFTVPGQGRTVGELLAQLCDQERCERVGPL